MPQIEAWTDEIKRENISLQVVEAHSSQSENLKTRLENSN